MTVRAVAVSVPGVCRVTLWHWHIRGPVRSWEQWASDRASAYHVALAALRGMLKLDRMTRCK